MSTTINTSTTTQNVLHVLADYDLHHSGDIPNSLVTEPYTRHTTANVDNPLDWDADHRRVPPYRPINRNLDWDSRPAGLNAAEALFIATMLNGVRLMAVSDPEFCVTETDLLLENVNSIWRATGGQLNDRFFRYAIGGEW